VDSLPDTGIITEVIRRGKMNKCSRRNHVLAFSAKVALEVAEGGVHSGGIALEFWHRPHPDKLMKPRLLGHIP